MNLISDAIKRGGSAASNLVTTHQAVDHVQAGKLNLPQSQLSVHYRMSKTIIINPTSQPITPLNSGGFVDFRITSSDSIKGITFAVTLQKDAAFSGTATALVADESYEMFSHVEVYTENGSVLCTRTEAAHLKQSHADLAQDQYYLVKAGLEGGNGVTTLVATPAAGSQTVVYLPMLRNFLVDNHIMVSALTSPVTIRVWFNAGCMLALKDFEVSNIQLYCDQYVFDDSIRTQNIAKYQNRLDFRVMTPKFQKSAEVITPNVPFQLRLTSMTGMITAMSVKVFVAGAAVTIAKCDLLNESNQSILGGQALPVAYMQTVVKARQGRFGRPSTDTAIEADKAFHIQISEHEALNDSMGTIGGFFVSNGYHSLQIHYNASGSTPVNAIVEVLYSSVSTFTVNRGVTSMTHS
jgi:hypothetical protein